MKRKISKILGVGLSAMLIASLMLVALPAAPVAADTLEWDDEDGPNTDDEMLGPPGVDIISLAVNGDTIYAATENISGNATYKSTDGGATWIVLTEKSNFKLMAVAPDNADELVAVTKDNKVWYSDEGGSDYDELTGLTANTVVNAIDISSGSTRVVVVAGEISSTASLQKLSLAMLETWSEEALTAQGFDASTSIKAVKFSPSYSNDKIILTVTELDPTGATTSNLLGIAQFQVFWDESDAWNDNVTGYLDYTAANLEIDTTDDPNVTVASASIAVPSTYMGYDEAERIVFIGLATSDSEGGAYRFVDNFKKEFETWTGGSEGPIHSVAYHDSGKLIAGDYDGTGTPKIAQVFRCLSPMASTPKFERLNNFKQPGGEDKVIVVWNGDTAIAATSGDESAFAISTDDAYAFNDISLIDTVVSSMSDVTVSADGSKVYLTTYDASYDTSVWILESAWTRVLSKPSLTASTAPFLVRIAPDDDAVVYLASKNTQNMWVSKNSGKETWKSIPVYKLGSGDVIQDYVVESADVVYVIDDDGCSKTSNAGSSWGSTEDLGTAAGGYAVGYMITLAPNNDILIGGKNGYAAFSKDGGSSFTRTKAVDSGTNNYVHVVADEDYADNNIIYAGVGTAVKRGKADDTSSFSSRSPSIVSTHDVVGIAQSENVIYVLTANSTGSELHRVLNLQTADSSGKNSPLWSSLTTTATFQAMPQALKLSSGPTLWALDSALLYAMDDPIATVGPTLLAPADDASVPVNPGSGQAYDMTFTWERQDSEVSKMDLQIATDSAFDAVIYDASVAGVGAFAVTADTVAKVIGPTSSSNQRVSLMPSESYYWRVRVSQDGPMYSPWSETRSLKVEGSVAFAMTSPASGSKGVSLTPSFVWTESKASADFGYEIQLDDEPTFAIVEWSHAPTNPFYKVSDVETLSYSTTYYWRVRGITGPAVNLGSFYSPNYVFPTTPWASGVFTTMAEPVEGPIVITVPEPAQPPEVIKVPVAGPAQSIPSWMLLTIIGIGAVLVIALIVLIVRTRRVV